VSAVMAFLPSLFPPRNRRSPAPRVQGFFTICCPVLAAEKLPGRSGDESPF